MQHTKETCTANDLIIGAHCGLLCAGCGACKCGWCQRAIDLPVFSLKELNAIETLKQGHTDDLKIQSGICRIWLSRLTVEDGMPYNNQVTIEMLVDGKWKTRHTYQAL